MERARARNTLPLTSQGISRILSMLTDSRTSKNFVGVRLFVKPHYHLSAHQIVLTGVAAVIFIDVMGLIAAKLAAKSGIVGQFGTALGAVIPFKG